MVRLNSLLGYGRETVGPVSQPFNKELKLATLLSHGLQPEENCFPRKTANNKGNDDWK